jgi:Fe-S-cluster containining protein
MNRAPRVDTIPPFRDGFRFRCTRCGNCCTKLGRELPLLVEDVRRLARHLRIRVQTFVRRYCDHVADVVRDGPTTVRIPSLQLRVPSSGRCVFLTDTNRCGVHDAKPFVCAQSPFMHYVAGSQERWDEAVAMCPGFGLGRFRSARTLQRMLRRDDRAERRDRAELRAAGDSLARALGVRLPPPRLRRPRIL